MNLMKTKLSKRTASIDLSVLLLLLLISFDARAAQPVQQWSIAITGTRSHGDKPELSLDFVAQEKIHLIGSLTLENILPEDKKVASIVIDGTQGEDGTFRPDATLQVMKQKDGKWETVTSSLINSPTAKLTVYPGMSAFGLRVELDSLKQYIGKYKWGKVILKTGQEAVFDLNDLAPPSEKSSH
jgi:hypothetical protein